MYIQKFLVVALMLMAFGKSGFSQERMETYAERWQKVAAFEKKGLTASAIAEVNNILQLASAASNDPQQVKAAIFLMKFRNMVEEDNSVRNVFYLDTLISKAGVPAKNILLSMQAEVLWNYRNQNRYLFYNRTKQVEENDKDISTWSLPKLHRTILERYAASLENSASLKSTSLKGLSAVLEKATANTTALRPTVYDLLAHRALDYYTNEENDLPFPAYKFILNDERVFAPIQEFSNSKFSSRDSLSNYFHAILLLQELSRFHLKDQSPSALIDIDLRRLAFLNEHAVFTDRDKRYEAALKSLETQYASDPATAQAAYLRAELYHANGEKYTPYQNPQFQFELRKSKELCEQIISRFPRSEGAMNAKNLLVTLTTPEISIESEKVNLPGVPFRSLLKYKNVNTINLRVVEITRPVLQSLESKDMEEQWSQVLAMPALKTWELKLPDPGDHQKHSTEIKIDKLPAGTYILIASIDDDFTLAANYLSRQVFYVSSIGYIINSGDQFQKDYSIYVMNRDNGKPIAKAQVQFWSKTYNYGARRYTYEKIGTQTTDENGLVRRTFQKEQENFRLRISSKGDELFTDDEQYSYRYQPASQQAVTTFLFTDRSIYRPGQKLFFKGIVINKDRVEKTKPIDGYVTTVTLLDANGQKAGTMRLKTNKFGSYSGSFDLPTGTLPGMFQLIDSSTQSRQFVNVEEYKRPKFIVELAKPIGSYRVNDTIHVTGSAKSYAGNKIDGAKITYRVVRKMRFPPWFYGGIGYKSFPPYGRQEEMEITNGQAISDADGSFYVDFKAIPDENVDRKNQPIFYYEITVDVTDATGETRSAKNTVAVSYQALQVELITPESISADSIPAIRVHTANINGVFEKAQVTFRLTRLKSPGKIFRERLWEKPDQFLLSQETFTKDFPLDPYTDENEREKWPEGETLVTVTDTSQLDMSFSLKKLPVPPGWYKIIATAKDKYGEEVKAESFLKIVSEKEAGDPEPFSLIRTDKPLSPGEQISYSFRTGFEETWLFHSITKAVNPIETKVIAVKDRLYQQQITVTEADRGGLAVEFDFVKHNRFYTATELFSVPWTNKELQVSFETFRDKLLPGQEETWKIKISGEKAEKVSAEALISMYDASLDQFKAHSWNSLNNLWPVVFATKIFTAPTFDAVQSESIDQLQKKWVEVPEKTYPRLLENGWNEVSGGFRGSYALSEVQVEGYSREVKNQASKKEVKQVQFTPPKVVMDSVEKNDEEDQETPPPPKANESLQPRKNFKETAFFFPDLSTDSEGNISFSFKMPESVTTWKLMSMFHSAETASGYAERSVITQKPLMVQPNMPRFVRENDRFEVIAKVANLAGKDINGTARLELFDAITNELVDGAFKNIFPVQHFSTVANQSTVVKFPVEIPVNFNTALTWRITASSADGIFTDGEESSIPVLSNRILVTESLPLSLTGAQTKTFSFKKLIESGNNNSLTHQGLVVEYSSNPIWYAVQALPYLDQFPYDCAEQQFNRYFANSLAGHISNSMPKLRQVFERWKTLDSAALKSNLEKNEELKTALLQETPWVLAAKDEISRKQNIAKLFDVSKMAKDKSKRLAALKELQTPNGGFSWFKGGRDDIYITQYILSGIGHLKKLQALEAEDHSYTNEIVRRALPYLDARMKEEYEQLKKLKTPLDRKNLSNSIIQYLYMRSFFKENPVPESASTAYRYYISQAKKYWLSTERYFQAMIALALFRSDETRTAADIIASLKENSLYKEELGRYFKEFNTAGYYWYQSPIESQSLIIEAFSEIDRRQPIINEFKVWLLRQKQVQDWGTTRATAEACYALILQGSNWIAEENQVSVRLGDLVVNTRDGEAGTGYVKKSIAGDKVNSKLGEVTVSSTRKERSENSGISWGAVYWQYFDNIDKITASNFTAGNAFLLRKKLFVEVNSDKGPVLRPLVDGAELKVGDKIKVRIELKADRNLEYVHLKDLRAAAMEPVNVLSGYKWQDGLGYYESTTDAGTNFFFSWLPRGSYVLEYPLFVTHNGNFSSGIATVQCMYAPEFTAHSEGLRVAVEN